jgi:hypothetical protein
MKVLPIFLHNFRVFSFGFMVFSTTFNNISVISWQSVLVVEETGVPGENHRPVAGHSQTLSQNFVSGFELTTLVVIGQGTDCIHLGSCKSIMNDN